MPTYNVTYTPTTGGSLSATGTGTATTLGLLYTDAHLAEWRKRADFGPYKSAADSFDPLIPAEWDRIVQNKDTFVSAPDADHISSYWTGTPPAYTFIGEHINMSDAAFYSLVKEDSALAIVVKDELMWHANESGLQISPTFYQWTDGGTWSRAEWIARLLQCADYVKDQFSAGERTTFDAWISDWAYSYEYSIDKELSDTLWGDRYDRSYTTNLGSTATTPGYDGHAYMDSNGNNQWQCGSANRWYNNRRASCMHMVGLASVWLNDAVLKDRAKLFFEEWIQFNIFPDGSSAEFTRNSSSSPNTGLNYLATSLQAAISVAEALRLSGDSSLYDYSSSNGHWESACTTQPPKTIKLVVETFIKLISKDLAWYVDSTSVNESYRIDNTRSGKCYIGEITFAPLGNRYWKDDYIKQGYMHSLVGSIDYFTPLGTAGPIHIWGGNEGQFPSCLFLFSEMEDVSGTVIVVNPDVSAPITSSTSWQNRSFGTQDGIFNVEYTVVPSQSNMDGVTGLSFGSASAYNDLAVIIRFDQESGTFDARDGDVYTSDTTIPYTGGTSYHVRIVGDTGNKTYSVFITPDGESEVLLANTYAFRTSQSGVPSLDNLSLIAPQEGSHTVSNFTTGDYVGGQLVQTVTAGDDAAPVTATPDAEYGFVNWTGDVTSASNPLTLTNIQADTAVTANFAGGDQTLTYTAGAGGSVTGTSPQTVAYGSDGTAVTAVPDANYSFVDWSDSSTQNPRTDTSVSGDVTVTANFTIDTFTLSYSSSANGSLTGTTPQTIGYGSDGTAVTAVPEAGYAFVDWDDGSTANPRTDTNITANLSVSASFALDTAEFTVTFAVNGGTLTGDTSQLIVSGADCTAVTVVPNANYHFTQWNDANTDNPRTLTNVTSTQTLTATCVIDTYSVDFTAGTGGSITGTASQTIDHGSDATQVTATAATDYAFTAWSGDATGTTNPLTITNVTADKAITASFQTTIVDYTASTLVVSALSVLADGTSTSTITVQVKGDGVNATSGGHTVALVEDGNATISSVTDNSDGTYTATIINSTVESVTVSGTVNTEAISNTKAITFTSGLITRTRTDNNVTGKIGGC